MLYNTTQLWGQVSDTIPELGTVLLSIVPSWLSSFPKPRAWLYYSGPKLYYPSTKKDKRISWQGSMVSGTDEEIEF